MKNFLFIFILMAISGSAWQCMDKAQGKNSGQPEIPELKKRPKTIGPEGEMLQLLTTYESLVKKIKTNPKDFEARLELAELFMIEARISGEHGYYYPAALDLINGVLVDKPAPITTYRALLNKASVLLSLHQFAEALKTGEQALAIHTTDAGIYGVLVDANVELGNYAKAVEIADKMVGIRPDLRSYSRVSYLREIHGQIPGAIEALKLAISAGYPGMEQTEWARLTLGELYLRYGKIDSAAFHFNLSLSARPNYPFAISALAQVAEMRGNQAEAERLILQAADLIPEVGFFIDRAEWLKEQGKTEESSKLTDEILVMLADDEKAGHKMGLEYANVYLNLKNDPAKAFEYAQQEYNLRPENIDVNRVMGEIYLHQKNIGKAREHLEKALRTGSKDPHTLCMYAAVLQKSNEKENAEKTLQNANKGNPEIKCDFERFN